MGKIKSRAYRRDDSSFQGISNSKILLQQYFLSISKDLLTFLTLILVNSVPQAPIYVSHQTVATQACSIMFTVW